MNGTPISTAQTRLRPTRWSTRSRRARVSSRYPIAMGRCPVFPAERWGAALGLQVAQYVLALSGVGTRVMDRRRIIRILGGMAAFVAATAWPRGSLGAAKIPRVGIIDDGSDWGAFRQELHELNYVEAAARELAQIPVDVIAVYGTPA